MSKEILIKQHTYQKVEKEVPFNLPTEPLYMFKTGSRISIRVIPIWTKWKKDEGEEEEVWKFHITLVRSSFENMIQAIDIQVSSIPDIFRAGKGEIYEIVSMINEPENIRTKEQFDTDFNLVLKNITNYE
jgi:hypothetical protein